MPQQICKVKLKWMRQRAQKIIPYGNAKETDLNLLQNSKYIQKKWSRKEYNVAELNGVNAQNN